MAAASWDSFKIQLPGKDFLEPVRDVLQTLLVFLEVLKAILETVKIFLIDFPNPIGALVKALIELVNTFFESINRTGVYAWFDVPDPSTDPHFFRFQGGYQAFASRFKAGLLDTRDPNRPQPISGATQSGFICLVCDAQGPIEMLRLMKILMKFFNRDLHGIRYPAPANVKILPVGDKGDPILNLARVFEIEAKAVMMSWSIGGHLSSPDPGFNDLGSTVAAEFIPPNWLVERSSTPLNGKILASQLKSPNVAGNVMIEVETEHEIRGQPSKRGKHVVPLRDEFGEPIIRFEKVTTLETGSGPLALIGELGVMKWIDTDVQQDHTYYYRIRAYSGDLPVSGGVIQYNDPKPDVKTGRMTATLPDGVILGKPSPVFRVRVPKIPPRFNVIQQLKNLFLTAFSLNFHLDAGLAKFTPEDDPIPPTDTTQIGMGSLVSQASALANFKADPFIGQVIQVGRSTSVFKVPEDPVTGEPVPPPWNEKPVRDSASRLAGIVGAALLEQGSGAIGQFQALMTGSFQKGTPGVSGLGSSVSEMCANLTALNSEGNVDQAVFEMYGQAYKDPAVRKNVLHVVRFIKAFTLGGTPPDWIQVSVLRDIIPWSGHLLYDILAKLQALLDAFKSVVDEIKNFIDMLVRKIEVLERFIEFLINILDFILSLSGGFYVLKLPSSDGDVFSWLEAIDNAGGAKPPSGPGGYSCGVAFAYVAVDVSAFAAAFDLIF